MNTKNITIKHITTNIAGIASAVKHSIQVNGRSAGYVFSGQYNDPQNRQTRMFHAEIMAYLSANGLTK
jgi:hypothetical protein